MVLQRVTTRVVYRVLCVVTEGDYKSGVSSGVWCYRG